MPRSKTLVTAMIHISKYTLFKMSLMVFFLLFHMEHICQNRKLSNFIRYLSVGRSCFTHQRLLGKETVNACWWGPVISSLGIHAARASSQLKSGSPAAHLQPTNEMALHRAIHSLHKDPSRAALLRCHSQRRRLAKMMGTRSHPAESIP